MPKHINSSRTRTGDGRIMCETLKPSYTPNLEGSLHSHLKRIERTSLRRILAKLRDALPNVLREGCTMGLVA